MITVKCAVCMARIKGKDIYERPRDGRPLCERCHRNDLHDSQGPFLLGARNRSSADSDPGGYDSSD